MDNEDYLNTGGHTLIKISSGLWVNPAHIAALAVVGRRAEGQPTRIVQRFDVKAFVPGVVPAPPPAGASDWPGGLVLATFDTKADAEDFCADVAGRFEWIKLIEAPQPEELP